MSPQQIELVQQSWAHAEPIVDTIVRLFYRRLFEQEPGLRDRFCTSMSEQGDHLLAATQDLVTNLANDASLVGLVGEVNDFNRQEANVIDAWLWAIEEEIGRLATPQVCDAWREAIRGEIGVTFKLVALGEVALVGV